MRILLFIFYFIGCYFIYGQTTVTIYPVSSTMNTGWVSSAGTKTSGDMQVSTSTSYGRGWAKFPLSSIPTNAIITSATLKFYVYGGTSTTTANTITGFTGNSVTMVGSSLYSSIGSGTQLNSSSWTMGSTGSPSLNSKSLSDLTFIQNQITVGYINIGLRRGSTNLYSIYGYSNSTYKIALEITYTICNGIPNEPIITLVNSSGCSGYSTASVSSSNLSTEGGISNQWQISLDGLTGWSNITNATSNNLNYTPNASSYFRLKSTCTESGAISYSNTVFYTLNQSPPIPQIQINGNTTFCQGDSLLLTSSLDTNNNYEWRKDGITVSSFNDSSLYVYDSGTYSLVATNEFGCITGSSELNIIVNPRPFVSISSVDSNVICQGQSTLLDAGNSNAISYQWYLNDSIISNANSNTYNATNSGNYSVLVFNSFNCSSLSSNYELSVIQNPIASINNQGISSLCVGGTVVLTANSGTGLTYQWANNGANISGETSSSYSAVAAGSYTVIVTNSSGCSTTSNTVVLTLNQLSATLYPLSSSMHTGYVSSNGTKTSGNLLVSSNTTNGRGWVKFPSSSIPLGSVITAVTIKFYTYGGSSSTTSNTIRGFTGDPVTMTGTTLYSTIGAGTVYNTSTWSIGTTSNPSLNTKVLSADGISYVQSQLSTGYINFGFVGGSTNLQSIYGYSISTYGIRLEITYNPPATSASISSTGNTIFCQGNSVSLNANTGSGLTYQWKNNGSNISGTSSSYTATSSGNYTVQVTNSSGCSAISNPTIITVNPLPAATLSNIGLLTFCQGGSVTLNANIGPGLNYQWKKNGAIISGITTSSYIATTTGSYTVVITNSNGCLSTSNALNVTVNPLPISTITLSGPTIFCIGNSITLSNNSGVSYQWKNNNVNINGATNPSYIANASGSYSVFITNNNGCTINSAPIVITVNPLPISTISSNQDTIFCEGGSTVLLVDNQLPLNYQWFKNGILLNGQTNSIFQTSNSGIYNVQLTDQNGCINNSSNSIQVIVNPNPYILISGDTNICNGETTILTANSNGNVTWNGNLIQNAFEVQPNITSTYSVSAIDSNNCLSTRLVIIEVNYPSDTTIYTSSYGSYELNGTIYTESGIYTQSLFTTKGCDSTITINLNYITNSIEENKEIELIIFPNPSNNGEFFLNYNILNSENIKIIDVLGKELILDIVKENENYYKVTIPNKNGIYFITLEDSIKKKIIINH